MTYDEVTGITYMREDEYEENIMAPLRSNLYETITAFYGFMYESGYAGYPGSSQSLNIDDPFKRIADILAEETFTLLAEENLDFPVKIVS